ncbi:MAG: DUF2842 domain-containing protein [Sphingobium sp.]|jgi:hypothetical protein|nr:MAG: DUF2842 domain-containing protein [Sphingobium sp.]
MNGGPQPSWRKPFGMFLILALITVWAVSVASLSGWIGRLPTVLQLIIYVFAGIAWILPLRPLLAWMETGRWKP